MLLKPSGTVLMTDALEESRCLQPDFKLEPSSKVVERTITACLKSCTDGAEYGYSHVTRVSALNAAHSRPPVSRFVWCNSCVWKYLRKLLHVFLVK